MQDDNLSAVDIARIEKPAPDLTPLPQPTWSEIEHNIVESKLWLNLTANDQADPRGEYAQRLLKIDQGSGMTRIDILADLAFRSACEPRSVPVCEISSYTGDMAHLVYDASDDYNGLTSPFYFLEPTPLLEIFEMAIARTFLRTGRSYGIPTRALARLARVSTKVVEQQLDLDGFIFEPYGVSMNELREMKSGDRLYWYNQNFVFGIPDIPEWLLKFPGFTPLNEGEFQESPEADSLEV